MLQGIIPIVFIPFDQQGSIDEAGLRRIVHFELEGGVDGIGINGFASEAYKLTDDERRRAVDIVAAEVGDSVPLVIGIAPGSTEAAIQQAQEFARYQPATLMVLPPATMKLDPQALVDHYVTLGDAADSPIMIQQSPHIQAYSGTLLSAEPLAEAVDRCANIHYLKIEGPGAADRIAALSPLVDTTRITMFGGGGGITLPDELRAGSSGLIPGVGFNEYFVKAWPLWASGKTDEAMAVLDEVQPLVSAVSGPGHEFSLHARKYLMKRAGYIDHTIVRRPTISVTSDDMTALDSIVDNLDLRIARRG